MSVGERSPKAMPVEGSIEELRAEVKRWRDLYMVEADTNMALVERAAGAEKRAKLIQSSWEAARSALFNGVPGDLRPTSPVSPASPASPVSSPLPGLPVSPPRAADVSPPKLGERKQNIREPTSGGNVRRRPSGKQRASEAAKRSLVHEDGSGSTDMASQQGGGGHETSPDLQAKSSPESPSRRPSGKRSPRGKGILRTWSFGKMSDFSRKKSGPSFVLDECSSSPVFSPRTISGTRPKKSAARLLFSGAVKAVVNKSRNQTSVAPETKSGGTKDAGRTQGAAPPETEDVKAAPPDGGDRPTPLPEQAEEVQIKSARRRSTHGIELLDDDDPNQLFRIQDRQRRCCSCIPAGVFEGPPAHGYEIMDTQAGTDGPERANVCPCLPVMHPKSPFRMTWNVAVFVSLLYRLVVTPFYAAFAVRPTGFHFAAELLFDLLLCADVFFNFFTAYYQRSAMGVPAVVLMQREMVANHYLTTDFACDVIGSLPIDIALFSIEEVAIQAAKNKLLHAFVLIRLLRFRHVSRYVKFNPVLVQMRSYKASKFLEIPFMVVVACHYLGCLWFVCGERELASTGHSWVMEGDTAVINESPSAQYVSSMYWAVSTMTSVGYGDIIPHTVGEYIFVMFAMLLSSAIFASFIGTMTTQFASMNSLSTLKSQKLEFVAEYLRIHKLPTSLQHKVFNFYEHCWQRLKSFPFSEHVILEELSPYLRKEVIMAMNSEMVQKVPFFQNQESNFVINLLLCLQPEIFAPLDLIFVQGEVGHEMYFLRQGQVAVGNTDMSTIYTKLYDGAYFGEVALLMHGRRTATIQAVYQSDILGLSRLDLDRVLEDFPYVKQKIFEIAAKANYKMEKSASSRVLHIALEKKASQNATPAQHHTGPIRIATLLKEN